MEVKGRNLVDGLPKSITITSEEVREALKDIAKENNIKSIRIDTHKDNIPMQRALAKHGFIKCGIIHLANGDERIAFQKSEVVNEQ